VRYRVPVQERTLLHELGHALGLPHATGPNSLMSERPSGSTLTGTDIALARGHYSRSRCVP
jgi:predicted Zn-dependent protease